MYATHPAGVQTALKAGKRHRVLTTFPDATELVEEYDAVTLNLECRRWRSTRPLGGTTEWEYEIGDCLPDNPQAGTILLHPSSLNPTFHPRDTRKAWEWHFRNLPYPEETYSLAVDDKKQALVLRTTNKKYFKVFKVPALVRAGLPLERSSVKYSHDGRSTLVITYTKPESIIEEEREARASARNGSSQAGRPVAAGEPRERAGNEGPPECKQS